MCPNDSLHSRSVLLLQENEGVLDLTLLRSHGTVEEVLGSSHQFVEAIVAFWGNLDAISHGARDPQDVRTHRIALLSHLGATVTYALVARLVTDQDRVASDVLGAAEAAWAIKDWTTSGRATSDGVARREVC